MDGESGIVTHNAQEAVVLARRADLGDVIVPDLGTTGNTVSALTTRQFSATRIAVPLLVDGHRGLYGAIVICLAEDMMITQD